MKLTQYKAQQIADFLKGEHVLPAPNEYIINLIADSRKTVEFEKILFVAVKGRSINGHQFIKEMYHKGVRNFMISEPVEMFPDANYFMVKDTLESFLLITSRFKLKQTHQTQLEVDLDALCHNLQVYQSLLHSGVKTMVMVKAFGYGNGGPELSKELSSNNVDYLGVAYADEGVAIRKAGVTIPIMVMNPMVNAFTTMINNDLEPEIYSLDVFEAYSAMVNRIGAKNDVYKIHLKVDTGMNRLGFKPDDIEEFLSRIKTKKHFKVVSVFSHLAASDDEKFDDFTNSQINLFAQLATRVEGELGYSVIKHISNTGGIERFDSAQFDMVRLGIGLYGIAKESMLQKRLHTVSSLRSIVIQIKNVNTGESVGYNRSFVAEKDMEIAVIPIGYADGLSRSLGNQAGSVFVAGQKRPIIGNISMDLIMVDITGLGVHVNDSVEIFGDNIDIAEVARLSNTISYEVFTGVALRVKRVYNKVVL